MAAEYFLGDATSALEDQFSLGVIAYQMITGKLPYGDQAAKIKIRAQLQRLSYISAIDGHISIPSWIDDTLTRVRHPEPEKH